MTIGQVMSQRPERRNRRAIGVSLMETVVSLAVFSAVVLPLAIVPPKAIELSKENQNSSLLSTQGEQIFDVVRQDTNLSTRFLPFWEAAANDNLTMPRNKMVFMAYTDNLRQKEVRVGYQLQEIFQDAPANQTPYQPRRWKLLRQYLSEDTDFHQLEANNSRWQPIASIQNKNSFYLSGSRQESDVMFVYCQGARCAADVNPKAADGLRIQSGPNGGDIRLVYDRSVIVLPPVYAKLASLQSTSDRSLANHPILPVSMATNRWDLPQSWLGEVRKKTRQLGTYRVPVSSSQEAQGNAMALPMHDFHYNLGSGELLGVSHSPQNVPAVERSLYLFKFRPGMPDYRPYRLSVQNSNGASQYSDNFPLVITQGEAAWPPGAAPQYLGITQDKDDNIYVLAKSTGFWIIKFSPDGEYRSRFNISANLGAQTLENNTIALSYSPAMPNDLMVFAQNTSGQFTLRAYPKDQNQDDPYQTLLSATSKPLSHTPVASLGPTWRDFRWEHVKGMDYDPLHHRFLFIEESSSQQARVISMAIDMQGSNRSIKGALVGTANLYPPGQASTLRNPMGIAYDALSNTLFVTTDEGNRYPYYRIVPNTVLNSTEHLRRIAANR